MHFFTKTKFLTSEPHRLSERVERSSGEMIVTMWGPCRSDSVAHDRLWKALYENKFVQKRLSWSSVSLFIHTLVNEVETVH